jgi:pectate lyase
LTYDKAGMIGITVNSNKSLVGQGNKGVIKGKGLRMANGVKNIIIQVGRTVHASFRISNSITEHRYH